MRHNILLLLSLVVCVAGCAGKNTQVSTCQAEKEQLLDCLYAVATADETASFFEEEEIRAVARALMLSHDQFIQVRLRYKDKIELLTSLRDLRRS